MTVKKQKYAVLFRAEVTWQQTFEAESITQARKLATAWAEGVREDLIGDPWIYEDPDTKEKIDFTKITKAPTIRVSDYNDIKIDEVIPKMNLKDGPLKDIR
jgi:hypothetical protein